MKYKIEKDIYVGCWIVWEKVGKSAYNDIYHAKTKRECTKWIKTIK